METIDLHKVVDIALKVEEKGAEIYNQLAEKYFSNQELYETFKLLAKDEQIHYNQFQFFKKNIPEMLDNVSQIDKELLDFVDPLRFVPFFESAEEDLNEILKVCYNFEKDTYLFYSAVRDLIGDNEVLNNIIKAEKSHIVSLFKYIVTDSKFRGISDKF
ncbi:hypothetical protein D9V84_02160 [Bacteroidetes/Chlorobi group bacterium Naka2016]|jgi:rubrerythrin|nr:MAG: hypothetical protein D9V84_02160 [Bacteroidetes/Chlorobi group bacterium Naka2016]